MGEKMDFIKNLDGGFSVIENEALKLNKELNDLTLKEMDFIWEEAISKENKN